MAMDDAMTSGEVARLCGVAPRTVKKWCDLGGLPHWRLPVSGDRRIDRAKLAAWLDRHGVPVPAEIARAVLLAGFAARELYGLTAAMIANGRQVATADTVFELLSRAQASQPSAVIADVQALGRWELLQCGPVLAQACLHTAMWAVRADDETEPAALENAGWRVIGRPVTAELLEA